MIYGYARCSTNESKQDINRQVRELKAAGAEQIFLEYEHGDSKIKSQQRAMLEQAQAGDSIITPELEHRKSGYVERKRRPYQGNVVRIA